MSSEQFFARIRGRITGPFDRTELAKLLRRGWLSRVHQVSSDGVTWHPASEYRRLLELTKRPLPGQQRVNLQSQSAPEGPAHPWDQTGADSGGHVALPDTVTMMYYSRAGQTVGPIPQETLHTLARDGGLHPDDPVWQKNEDRAQPARFHPGTRFAFGDGGIEPVAGDAEGSGQAPRWDRRTYDRLNRATGWSAACLILFCLHIPFPATSGELRWWWDLIAQGEFGWTLLLSLYLLCAGLALVVLAVMAHRHPIGSVYSLIGLLGYGLLTVGAAIRWPDPLLGVLVLVVPIFCILILSLTAGQTDRTSPWSPLLMQAACVLLLGVILTCAVFGVTAIRRSTQNAILWTPPVIAATCLAVLGWVCAMGVGITGMVGSKATASAGAHRTCRLLAVATLILTASAGVVFGLAYWQHGGGHSSRMQFVSILRLIALAMTFSGLVSVGLLNWLNGRSESTGNPEPQFQSLERT